MFEKINKLIDRIGVYLLALGAVILNISLAFDNVVWGDEAYSQMAIIDCDFYGIFERVYYWDSHPPLYYYYLRIFADIFGYNTVVYHIASLVPFVIGIVLAVTLIKKHLGAIPAVFFIIVSGFSASCSEYNLEIRMYSLVFMFTLLCAYCAYMIIKEGGKLSYFILMTLFGVLSAYTHYYGLAVCGLIIFFAGFVNFAGNKNKKAFFKWFLTTVIYIVVYIPWLFVLYFQTQAELGNSWMTEPDAFDRILNFITGGENLRPVMLTFVIVMTIVILIKESGLATIKKGEEKVSFYLALHKPSRKNWSCELKGILFFYVVIALLLGFGYGVSYLFHPILTYRYTYVLIPLVLFIFMLCMKRLIEYNFNLRAKYIIVYVMLLATLIISLFDFKYFRSLSKTQDIETKKVLDIVGTPNEDAVLVSNGVKHLAWSVLKYYYPNEVTTENPNKLGKEPSEIWAFIGDTFDNDVLNDMKKMGYKHEAYMNMWLGKYAINLYHFYRE
ncbi:MAG: glycosyltransferase family 39 protein [Lachnospiraceae bacterium]|nr:glycosyltransferase family 39 protein [Lachnospiraceae bacterium]